MDWASLLDFRFAAALQAFGFVLEWLAYAIVLRRAYPWREAGRSLLIAVPAFVFWGVEIQLVAQAAAWLGRYRLFALDPRQPAVIAAAFILAELHFYVTHVLQHRVSWLWADHQVHHSSTSLNIFDGNRLGWTILLAGGFNTLFLPLVLVGFDGGQLIACSSAILLFQFFLHTQAVPRLGVLEKLLNTPSNHRAHHASDPEYLDCNFGGATVLFDRLFGTWVPERAGAPITYGLRERDTGRDGFLGLLFGGWAAVYGAARVARGPRGVLRALFGSPGSGDGTVIPMRGNDGEGPEKPALRAHGS